MPTVFNAVDELSRDKETLVQVNDILVKPGFHFHSFAKVVRVSDKSVSLVSLEVETEKSIVNDLICTLIVKPGNPIGEPFTKKNLDEYDLYDPSRVYYDVMY